MSTTRTVRLTDAQAETIRALISGGWSEQFGLHEPFPARDNRDNGARRCLRQLALKGLVVPVPGLLGAARDGGTFSVYSLAPGARAAYDAWYRRRGWELDE